MNETNEQRNKRKSIWIAKATAHFDTPKIRKEADKMFEKKNKKMCNMRYKHDFPDYPCSICSPKVWWWWKYGIYFKIVIILFMIMLLFILII